MTNSRISGFYNLTIEERLAKIADAPHLTPKDLLPLRTVDSPPKPPTT